MNTSDRYDLYDKLPVMDMKIWPNEEEMEVLGKNYWEWSEIRDIYQPEEKTVLQEDVKHAAGALHVFLIPSSKE